MFKMKLRDSAYAYSCKIAASKIEWVTLSSEFQKGEKN